MYYTCIYIIYIYIIVYYTLTTSSQQRSVINSQDLRKDVLKFQEDFRSATVLGRLHCGSRDLEAPGRPGISLEDIMGYLWGVLKWNILWDTLW